MGGEQTLFPLLNLVRLRMDTDGAGVTTLVAGKGCPLSCKYCLNRRILAQKTPEWVTPKQLAERAAIDNLYFQATGGGLCFGGGEALLHARFIAETAALVGGAWRITVETSLNVPSELLEQTLGAVDAYIVDVKTMDPQIYKAYTGGSMENVLLNLKRLAAVVPPQSVLLRVPLIPGFNDETDRARSVAKLKELGFTRFDLFTYKTEVE